MNQEENRYLGFWSMVLLGINVIIGSGIFLLPGKVMSLAGNWSLVVYLFVSLLVLSVAWCFAQCAALFNRNGGAYVYAKEAFGEFIGFEIGVMRWVIGIMAWAAIIVGFLTALSSIWPAALQQPNRSIIIISLVGCLGLLNLIGIKMFKYINNFMTIAKLVPLLFFALIGIFFLKQSNYHALNWQGLEVESIGAAGLILFYAFGGFESLVVAAGEMENPRKNLPLAVMIVMIFCSLLYFLIQVIAMGLLGDALAESTNPLADSAELLIGSYGKWFVTIAMLISIGGINLSASFVTPFSGVALAEDGMIPRWIAFRGRFGTPVWAIIITSVLTGLLALTGSFTHLVVISVVSRFAQYISTCIAAYVLHKRLNDFGSSYNRMLFHIIPLFALCGLAWLLCQATLSELIWGLGALVLAVPFYWYRSYRLELG